ncbi:hypothetical protein Bbelb_182000 [Branchiostoma belcheri]|nr:hypothetical protein Bbelb_182000 [Branchiostoma belcheri]
MAYGKCMRRMGWTLVVMGFPSITLGIAADVTFASMGDNWETLHYISAPIWNGVFVVITGILAIKSGKRPTSKDLIVMAFVAAIMPCCGLANNPNGLPVVLYNQLREGPDIAPGQAAYLILPTDAQGAAGGMPQQQVFIAQHPNATSAPMQRNYGTMAPPPYMSQSTIGAAAAQPPAAGQPPSGPPAQTKTQPPT